LSSLWLWIGIGSIPDAVLSKLKNHRDLGIHSEMFSDGIIPLVECGAITNSRKVIQAGKIVGGFAYGSKKLYDFMNNNPFIGMWFLLLVLILAVWLMMSYEGILFVYLLPTPLLVFLYVLDAFLVLDTL